MEIKANKIHFEFTRKNVKVIGEALIFDEKIVFKFSKPGVAKEIYNFEKRRRSNVRFIESDDVYIELYEGKSQAILTEYMKQKLLVAGWKQR